MKIGPGEHYLGNSFLEAMDVYSYISNPSLLGVAVPGYTWVEVTHTVFPGDLGVMWFYMSVGSGVWFNVGNTAAYDDHSDAVSEILQSDCHDETQDTYGDIPTECELDFPDLYETARSSLGLNSIQFRNHHDCMSGGDEGESSYKYNRHCMTEIINLDDPGAENGCGNSNKGGWEASTDCDCTEEYKSETRDETKVGGPVSYANCGAY